MKILFGKHKGKSAELVVLEEPDYVNWAKHKPNPTGPLVELNEEFRKLVKKFDQKPVQRKCMGCECSAPASYITLYQDNLMPYWWCDNCDFEQMGASAWKVQTISSYFGAISHVLQYCGDVPDDFKELITAMAQAKGLPTRVGEPQAAAFFLP